MFILFKVGLSPSKKNWFICFNESPLKMMKNAFYFILFHFINEKVAAALLCTSMRPKEKDMLVGLASHEKISNI